MPIGGAERRVAALESAVVPDAQRPSQARIYDYLLGGSHNFAVDREAARRLIAMVPDVVLLAQANRAFLRRAVRFLVAAGVRQFLDIGSGVPTSGNVHEIAQQAAPESRVVYVDIDPTAVADGRRILTGNGRAAMIHGDARRPGDLLDHPQVRDLIDFTRPVAILLVSVLHFLADEDRPAAVVATLRDAVVPGSHLALSHVTSDASPQIAAKVSAANERTATFAMARTTAEVTRFCDGFDLVEPGLVAVTRWRPERPEDLDADRDLLCMCAGVGCKP
jgi:S-adenosyl methyltransferase